MHFNPPLGKIRNAGFTNGIIKLPRHLPRKDERTHARFRVRTAYIDDILIVTSGPFEDHLNKLDQVLSRLSHAGLKTKAKIVLLSTRTRISRILDNPRRYSTPTKKIEAIKKTAPPKSKKESRSFIGLVNYYRDVWIRRSDVLTPLAKISGKNAS